MEVNIDKVMEILVDYYSPGKLLSAMEEANDPYKLLVGTILSLRTRDEITWDVVRELFQKAPAPQDILNMDIEELEKLIHRVNFHYGKARNIKEITRIILEKYNGRVPDTLEELMAFKGVGIKTANLVLSRGFNIPAIVVDTHVHRISNRLGYVKTKTPEKTEEDLRKKLPHKWWMKINSAFIRHGQETCKPGKPYCYRCVVEKYCNKVDVISASPLVSSKRTR